MTEDELLAAIQREVNQAEQDLQGQDFYTARDYYDGKRPLPFKDKSEKKYCDITIREVANAVEATIDEIEPVLNQGGILAKFECLGQVDEVLAEMESRIVNRLVKRNLRGASAVFEHCLRDAELFKNAISRVYIDTSTKILGRRFQGVPIEAIPAIGDMGAITGGEQNEDGTYTVDAVWEEGHPKFCIDWVPVDQFLCSVDLECADLNKARFVGWRRRVAASALVAYGIPKEIVDDLGADNRPNQLEHTPAGSDRNWINDRSRMVTIIEIYYLIDQDDDGIAERHFVLTAGGSRGDNKLIYQEPVMGQPFVNGVTRNGLRGWRGISKYDRLQDFQDLNSQLTRQHVDANWRNLQGRTIFGPDINYDDALASLQGGVVRTYGDPTRAAFPFPNVELSPTTLALLDRLDNQRAKGGGASTDISAQAQQITGDSAHGVERIVSLMERQSMAEGLRMANTFICGLFLKAHEVLRTQWKTPLDIAIIALLYSAWLFVPFMCSAFDDISWSSQLYRTAPAPAIPFLDDPSKYAPV